MAAWPPGLRAEGMTHMHYGLIMPNFQFPLHLQLAANLKKLSIPQNKTLAFLTFNCHEYLPSFDIWV